MKKYIITMLIVLIGILGLKAQEITECETLIADSVEMAELEANLLFANRNAEIVCNKIRVVVHVVYTGTIANVAYNGKISEEQVLSQIRITNQFFRNDSLMYNPDNNALGYEIELAKTDPQGNPTTGIIYHDGTLVWPNWAQYGLKNTNPNSVSPAALATEYGWGTDIYGKKYLNSYVVHTIDGNNGSGVQAFAWFPTTSIVYGNYNLSNAFGAEQLEVEYGQNFALKSYTDLGYTWTHELGHNFALFHTFQGQSCAAETSPLAQGDRVADTPPQTQASGCMGSCGFVSYNVMDYLNQICKNRWTAGQVARAGAAIQSSLPQFLACTEVEEPCLTTGDINGDGVINILDISILSSVYGTIEGDPNFNPLADLNCDGIINLLDTSILSSKFGTTTSQVQIINERPAKKVIYDLQGKQISGTPSTGFYIIKENGKTETKFIEHKR